MTVNIICIGKLKEAYWRDACAEYAKRLSRFTKLAVYELAEERLPDNASPAQEQAAYTTMFTTVVTPPKNR